MFFIWITNRNSFQNIKSWIEDCRKKSPKTVFLVLIRNKVDLKDRRQVTYEEGSIYAEKNGMLFFETSVKTGRNIEKILKNSLEIAKKIDNGFYDLTNDSCGIKQRFNSETIVLYSNDRNEQGNGYCCIVVIIKYFN